MCPPFPRPHAGHRYGSDGEEEGGLQFGYFDGPQWPTMADKLGVSRHTWNNQLPSVLLFKKGKEKARVPTKAATQDFTKRNFFTRVRARGWVCVCARVCANQCLYGGRFRRR